MIYVFAVTLILIFIYLIGKSAEEKQILACVLGIVGLILVTFILPIIINIQPKAMDVYKGKTTLEITYKDGIAVDSIVVFKNK